MLHAEVGAGLRGLAAVGHAAALAASVRRAEGGTAHSRFVAAHRGAALAAPVSSAEELVPRALVAVREGTALAAAVSDAELGSPLCTLRTAAPLTPPAVLSRAARIAVVAVN